MSDGDSRVALVTASGRNIGRAIAIEFAHRGLAVAVNTRSNEAEGLAVVEELQSRGARAMYVRADVSSESEVRKAVDRVANELGPISVLVNNAAVRPRTALLDMTLAEWNWVFGVGLTGGFLCSREVIPMMLESGGGCIVNISGTDGFAGMALRAHGSAVKAGLHGLTKSMAKEFGPQGIRVNTVVPTFIQTTRPAEWYPDWDQIAKPERMPLRRLGLPEDIARACGYLLDATYVTGQVLHVNGGFLMP